MPYKTYSVGEVELQNGGHLPDAKLAYWTYGRLNDRRDNAILFPTWFTGTNDALEWLIGRGRSLDPNTYFIICCNILGNGRSSSPSNTAPPFDRGRFPNVSLLDNVLLQYKLIFDHLGVEKLALIVGRSMGAQIAFQWASYFPDLVERILPICGSARTSHHNFIFLAAVKSALTSDPAWQEGEYEEAPTLALRNMRLIYDGWVLSQAYYRKRLHLNGFNSTQEYLDRPLVAPLLDVNDLLAQIWTWQNADISDNARFRGDFAGALGAINARAIVMPCRSDLYFPPEDSAIEVSLMKNAELRVIESVWGHRAGAPGTDPADVAFLDSVAGELLRSDF